MITSLLGSRLANHLDQPSDEEGRYAPRRVTISQVNPENGLVKFLYTLDGMTALGKAIESDWAPILQSMFGSGGAACFLPKPGDEAIAIFPHRHLSAPVVIGFLPKPGPLPPNVGRGNHGIVLASGAMVVVREATENKGESVVVSAGGASIKIQVGGNDGKDGNSIEVTVPEGGCIKLSALTGTCTIDAENIAMKATTSLRIEAPSVEIEATNGNLDLQGGPRVNIN